MNTSRHKVNTALKEMTEKWTFASEDRDRRLIQIEDLKKELRQKEIENKKIKMDAQEREEGLEAQKMQIRGEMHKVIEEKDFKVKTIDQMSIEQRDAQLLIVKLEKEKSDLTRKLTAANNEITALKNLIQ